MAVHGPEVERYREAGTPVPKDLEARIEKTRAAYERWLDAHFAAARGHVDALIDPRETRDVLALAVDAACASGHREHRALELL